MGIVDRLKLALQSEIGVLLLALIGFILLLGIAYLFLAQRKKRSDALAYRYQAHFDKAEEKLGSYAFTSPHRPTLFGRETICKGANGYLLCRIAPPPLATTAICERYHSFYRTTKGQQLPVFASYEKVDSEVTLQKGIVDEEGRRLPTLLELSMDHALHQAQVEEVLLEITKGMSALHSLSADNGGALYHGFLLPQSVYIDLDPQRKVREVIVGDSGVLFSLGARRFYSRLEALKKGKVVVDKYLGQQLLEQSGMLAPEQRIEERLDEVGPTSDFYAFGALAVSLFTGERFSLESVQWDKVPTKWRPFLERCLSDDPEARPKDFLDITDWLFDPELALTRHEGAHKELKPEIAPDLKQPELGDLKSMMQKIQARKSSQRREVPEEAERFLKKAQSALAQSKWALATGFLEKAGEKAPKHPEVMLGLAIASYEQGLMEEAEKLHRELEQLAPEVARRFHEHLACKR